MVVLKIDSWGFSLETGWIDLYLRKEALILGTFLLAGHFLYKLYKNRD